MVKMRVVYTGCLYCQIKKGQVHGSGLKAKWQLLTQSAMLNSSLDLSQKELVGMGRTWGSEPGSHKTITLRSDFLPPLSKTQSFCGFVCDKQHNLNYLSVVTPRSEIPWLFLCVVNGAQCFWAWSRQMHRDRPCSEEPFLVLTLLLQSKQTLVDGMI